jgi:hypothetical protein
MPRPAAPTFAEMKTALQHHQIERLAGTYPDLAENPRWKALADFFFTDLYVVGDLSERNESFLRLYKQFERVFDAGFLSGVRALIRFYFLSDSLDDDVTRVLLAMGNGFPLTSEQYEKAYRCADNYDDRVLQIAYVDETLAFVHGMSQRRVVGFLISTMQATARLIGASVMVDFLNRGYTAFRSAPDITYFKNTIVTRERERLDRIWRDYPPDARFMRVRDVVPKEQSNG